MEGPRVVGSRQFTDCAVAIGESGSVVGSDDGAFAAFVLRIGSRDIEAGLVDGENEWISEIVVEEGVGYGGCGRFGEEEREDERAEE